MKNRGSTLTMGPIRNIHTECEANPWSVPRAEVDDNDDDDGHGMIARVIITR